MVLVVADLLPSKCQCLQVDYVRYFGNNAGVREEMLNDSDVWCSAARWISSTTRSTRRRRHFVRCLPAPCHHRSVCRLRQQPLLARPATSSSTSRLSCVRTGCYKSRPWRARTVPPVKSVRRRRLCRRCRLQLSLSRVSSSPLHHSRYHRPTPCCRLFE